MATLDTKAPVVREAQRTLASLGVRPLIIDVGARQPPRAGRPFKVLLSVRDTLRDRQSLRNAASRQHVVDLLTSATLTAVPRALKNLQPGVVLAIAGSAGADIVLPFMATLPTLLPKILLTTLDPGPRADLTPNLMVFRSPFDLEGSHALLNIVIRQASTAAGALARVAHIAASAGEPYIALSQLGVTTPCVKTASRELHRRGFVPMAFHAVAAGGVLMERFLSEGLARAALDLTLSDITTAVLGGLSLSNPERIATPARLGIPMVVVPGAVNSAIFGPLSSLPARYRFRKLLTPTQAITVVRLNSSESAQIGRLIGRSVAAATAPVEVLVPRGGFSSSDIRGGETARDSRGRTRGTWFDPEANIAFVAALRTALRGAAFVKLTEFDSHINDPRFAYAAVSRLFALLSTHRGEK